MLQRQIFRPALRQTPLQRGASQISPSKAPLPRLPRLHQPLVPRSQHRTLSQLSRKTISARPAVRASWQKLKVSPFRSVRRYSNDKPAQSLSERFKELSRKYGWAAVVVYLGLSALDFPFCFLAVRLIGPDRIGEVEHKIVDWFWHWVAVFAPSMRPQEQQVVEDIGEVKDDIAEDAKVKKDNASIWTQLLLAYGLHKSLMIFRVPLTAAVTPKIVKTLRKWGYNIGPRVKKPIDAAAK